LGPIWNTWSVNPLDLAPVGRLKRIAGRLHRQPPHALQDGVHLIEGTFGRLDQADGVLGVRHGLVQARHLRRHLLRDGQAGGVVGRAVDAPPGRQPLKASRQKLLALVQARKGGLRRAVVVDHQRHVDHSAK
jgi:hypothetical protein